VRFALERKLLSVALDTFAFMIENYHKADVIDHAAWIIEKRELEEILVTLGPYASSGLKVPMLEMSEKEYDTFIRLIDYAGNAAPKQADRSLLERLYEICLEREDPKNRAYLVLTFEPLAMLNTVFIKMQDDSEAIDNSMYDLTSWEQFETLTAKFEELHTSEEQSIIVPMTQSEWATYSSYAHHAYDLDDCLTPEELVLMEEINADIASVLLAPTATEP